MSSNARKTAVHSQGHAWSERLRELPALPVVAFKIQDLLNDPRAKTRDLSELIRTDQVITGRLLQLANSSYYSIPGGVATVERALSFLGFSTVAQLVLGLAVSSVFRELRVGTLTTGEFWKHAFATGLSAEKLARRLEIESPEDAFTAGLLHDLGKLALHQLDPGFFKKIVLHASEAKSTFAVAEKELGAISHAELGAEIAEIWGLPARVAEAIRLHHSAGPKPLLAVTVEVGNLWSHARGWGQSGGSVGSSTEFSLPAPLGAEDANTIQVQVEKELERMGGLFDGSP